MTRGAADFLDAIQRARSHSPFLKVQLERFPSVARAIEIGDLAGAVALALAEAAGEEQEDVAAALRRERSAMALALGIGDLAGALNLEQVVEALSALADRSIEKALAEAFTRRTPGEEQRGFCVIALGKLGSRELNYSSDVDLLFLFDPVTLPVRAREEPGQGAVRIAQIIVDLLQKRNAEGYAFRVDLRLRPSPEVTPIALPVDAAISYYESAALPWERAAFVRARLIAGDRALGAYFLEAIHPFLWRRSLDFGAIQELQAISRRIRDHYREGQEFGPGYDLKRGRGGIREVEFFAQIHQLIHGGRDPEQRAPATLDGLRALASGGYVDAAAAADLASAYRLYRTIEHRLQMVEDRQTHRIPADGQELDNVAKLQGLDGGDDLLGLLRPHVARVAAVYGELAQDEEERFYLPLQADALEERLVSLGFEDAAAARVRIEGWRSRSARSLRSAAAAEAFEAMLPGLVEAFGASPDPINALNRFDDIVRNVPSGVNLYRLIEARPGLSDVLATILSHAPVLAEQLGRRPELLDTLIDETAFALPPQVEELAGQFARAERPGSDYQMMLDAVRRRVNERRFALGVQLITGRSDPLDVASGYARVAEAAVRVLAGEAISEFERRHGRVPGSELLILGLGRIGGEALTHASDLDLVYLFSGTHEARSDGEKPLGATEYFNRLAQRVGAALSVRTAAGPLYQVDTRLRPSGTDGLLAMTLESFERYQREQAWTWEHMALTRARPIFGSPGGRADLKNVLKGVLRMDRDRKKLASDAVAMRSEMAANKPPKGPFDIKLGEGGLVDLEFAVHVLQLGRRVALRPQLDGAVRELVSAGLAAAEIEEAHRLLTRMLVILRLVSPSSAEPPEASRPLVAAACGMEDWAALLAAHEDARQRVKQFWREVAADATE